MQRKATLCTQHLLAGLQARNVSYSTRSCLKGRDGTVVKGLSYHQCGWGSNLGPSVVHGVSLLLVPALRAPTLLNFNLISKQRMKSHSVDMSLQIPSYYLHVYLFFIIFLFSSHCSYPRLVWSTMVQSNTLCRGSISTFFSGGKRLCLILTNPSLPHTITSYLDHLFHPSRER